MQKRFTSVNLLWQQRFRGLAGFTAHSVSAAGETLVIQPDPLENRTYQVLSVDPQGESRELLALFVETVYQFDGTPDGRYLLAMTGDDLYFTRDSRKVRFLPERRVTYADACLATETGGFICGFSDVLFSLHGFALGDGTGRLLWSRDVDAPVNRVAISPDGCLVAIGLEDGRVQLFDQRRRLLCESELGSGVSALVLPAGRPWPVVGTRSGNVTILNEDGGVRWQGNLGLPLVAAATDTVAQWIVAAASNGDEHLLSCHAADGTPVWEHALAAAPTGVALSGDGRYLAVSTASGEALLFELELKFAPGFGTRDRRKRDLARAQSAFAREDWATAVGILAPLVAATPHDLEAGALLVDARRRLLEHTLAQVRELAGAGDYGAAVQLLGEAAVEAPWNAELLQLRVSLREKAIEAADRRARELAEERRWVASAAKWVEVLELDPEDLEARRSLAEVRRRHALELMQEGDACREAGHSEAARDLWHQAYDLEPLDEVEERLCCLEVERCVAAGMALYEAQRVPEALFQFKKALALDPENEPARKYLGYAQGITADSQIADRFARLE